MPPERNVSAPPRFVCEWSHRLYHEQSLCGIETVMCLHRLQPAHSLRHCCTADVQSTSASPPSVQLPCLAFSDKQPESAGVLPQYPALAAASQLALSAALGAGSAWLMSVGLIATSPGMHTPREARDGRERESRQTCVPRGEGVQRPAKAFSRYSTRCSEKNMLNIA